MADRKSYPASRLQYELPAELIAQHPPMQRGGSRLLHVRVADGAFSDHAFAELPSLLPPGCALVLNDSRVIPARVHGRRPSGAQVELLYHRWLGEGRIEAVVGSNAKLAVGERIALPEDWSAELLTAKSRDGSELLLRRDDGAAVELGAVLAWLERCGEVPLPPYIKRPSSRDGIHAVRNVPVSMDSTAALKRGDHGLDASSTADTINGVPTKDSDRYQTVYAAAPGSIAAPTAGLHFTPDMLAALRSAGHPLRRLTLHVGLGTFAPLRVDNLAEHRMHSEAYSLPPELPGELALWQESGVPVCAVGTTSLRVLHTVGCRPACTPCRDGIHAVRDVPVSTDSTAALKRGDHDLDSASVADTINGVPTGETAAFIYPGQGTHAADLLLTNFHLPGSTLLALVYAFGGEELMCAVYAHAIAEHYRFFSYGDCMLIDRRGARLTVDGTAQ